MNGVHGGSGDTNKQWMTGSDYYYKFYMSIHFQHWIQVKRVKNLCYNDTTKKRGEGVYDTCEHFDYVYKCLIQNVNLLTEEANIDLFVHETRWSTASYGEVG